MFKLRIILILLNLSGAVSTFVYFGGILPVEKSGPDCVPWEWNLIFFLGGSAFLALSFFLLMTKSIRLLAKVADNKSAIHDFDQETVYYLQRQALQLPMSMTMISFGIWILAGFLFGLVIPLIRAKLFGLMPPSLFSSVKDLMGIALLGGGETCLLLFFCLEKAWRSHIPAFFSNGSNRIAYGFRISVRKRFTLVLLSIILIPLPMSAAAIMTRIQAITTVGDGARQALTTALLWELGYISLVSLIVCLALAYLLSDSILAPLSSIQAAVKAVKKNDLSTRVEIMSNDELADMAQGINAMICSLKENEMVRDSLGRYVGREIRDEIMAGRVSLEGEMKRVTLLFCDLRNFTGLVEKNHPREVVRIINRYFDEMAGIIEAHGGLILQYIGDEIEAVFGAPVPVEDHPERAVKAALDMRQGLARLNRELAGKNLVKLKHGIGLHSGAVLAGNIGSRKRMSYALVGDTVNTASRIEGLSKDYGTDIILSKTTRDLLTGSYQTEQLPPVRVKGKEEELIIYKLLS